MRFGEAIELIYKANYVDNAQNRKLGRVGQEYGSSETSNKNTDLFSRVNDMESELDSLRNKVKMQVSYRSLKPKVTIGDYYISTKTEFEDLFTDKNKQPEKKEVDDKWEELKKDENLEFKESPISNSQYLFNRKTGDIYRKSDHWGSVASCYWKLDTNSKAKTTIAKSNVKDFSAYETDHPSAMVRNPEYNKKAEPILKKIEKECDQIDESTISEEMKDEGYSEAQIERAKDKFQDFKYRLIILKSSFQHYKENPFTKK